MAIQILVALLALFTSSARAGSVTFEDLQTILGDSSRNIRSIDQLLAQKEISRSFRSHYTLMFKSQSLHGADALNPRAIVYGEDAKLILAFAAPEAKNGNVLEIISWVDETKSFEFRSITFPESSQGSVQISDRNPKLCMTCHMGPDPRPNWAPYATWPGAYGGNDDYVARMPIDGEDRALLDQFLKSATTRPRYRALENLVDGYQGTGLGDNQRHNTVLSEHLSQLNAFRIFSRIMRLPYYDDIKHAVNLEIWGPYRFQFQLESAGLDEIGKLADACIHPKYGNPPLEFHNHVAEIVRLFSALDPAHLSWFMSFKPTLKDELVSPQSAEQDFIAAIWTQDPSLKYIPDELPLSDAGWRRLAKRFDLEAAFKKCADRAK